MPTNDSFTRAQLRSTQISTTDYNAIGLRTFTFDNNSKGSAYFSIEGKLLPPTSVITPSISLVSITTQPSASDSGSPYTGVSSSLVVGTGINVTASIEMDSDINVSSITVTGQSGTFSAGDVITFPSQSLGTSDNNGTDLVVTLISNNILSTSGIRKPIFNNIITEVKDVTNCTVITGSSIAGIVCNANTESSVNLYFAIEDTPVEDIEYRSTNPLVYSLEDPTASGSVFGISCTIQE